MNVLITGGSGFLGMALTSSLLSEGHSVTHLSRRPPTGGGTAVHTVVWDGATALGWGELVETSDVIVNLAGENIGARRWTPAQKAKILKSRILAGQAVSQAIAAAVHKPRVLIQASGIGYYGYSAEAVVTEQSPAGLDFLAQVSVAWENSTASVEQMGVRRVVLRTGIVLDAHQGALQRLLLQYRLFAGGPLGSGRQWFPWIALEDEIGAIRFLMAQEDASGPFNLCVPQPVKMSDFGRVLARVLKRPYWLPVPALALRLVLGEMSSLVLDGQRAVPEKLTRLNYAFQLADLESALRVTLKRSASV